LEVVGVDKIGERVDMWTTQGSGDGSTRVKVAGSQVASQNQQENSMRISLTFPINCGHSRENPCRIWDWMFQHEGGFYMSHISFFSQQRS
jgi:hypothetical protein